MRMKPFFYILFSLFSVFLISCEKYPVAPSESIDIPHKKDPYKPEINLPKEMRISGKYTFTENNKNFQFESEDQDWYCYYSIITDSGYTDEDIVSIRFRLHNKDNKLLRESLPVTSGRRFIIELNEKYPEKDTVTVWTYIPYHKDGVKIKAILVDDKGKDLKVLAERRILPPEEFRKRFFYKGCYREVGFGIE